MLSVTSTEWREAHWITPLPKDGDAQTASFGSVSENCVQHPCSTGGGLGDGGGGGAGGDGGGDGGGLGGGGLGGEFVSGGGLGGGWTSHGGGEG
jgi:hypothetical protein